EPLSSSFTLRARDGRSVVTLISEPARTFVSPVTRKSLPLRLRTIGGPGGGGAPRTPFLGPTRGPPLPAPAPPAAAAGPLPPGPAPPGGPPLPPPKPRPPPPAAGGAATVMRPTSPLHTAAFQSALISQASSIAISSLGSLMRM